MADGGECAFDGVRCSDVFPVLGGEVIEGKQGVPVFEGSVQSFSQICLNWRASFVYLKRFWVFVCLL